MNSRDLFFILASLLLGLLLSIAIASDWMVAFGFIFGSICLFFFCWKPVLGVYSFLLISLWQITILPGVTLSAFFGYLSIFAYIFNLLVTRKVRYRRTGQEWLFLFLLVSILISSVGAINLPWLIRKAFTLIQLMILYLLIANLINTRPRLIYLLWVVLLSNLITAGLAIYQYLQIPGFRAIGAGKDPNYTAASVMMGIFLGLAIFKRLKSTPGKLFLTACLIILVVAFLLTFSRGGFIALNIAGIFWIFREKNKGRALAIVFICLIIGALFMPEKYRERISTLKDFQMDVSISSRVLETRAAIMMIRDYPFFGVGFENMPDHFARYITPEYGHEVRAAHNLYLNLAADIGLVGLAIFIGIIITSWHSLQKAGREVGEDDWLNYASRMISLAFVGYLAASIFVSNLLEKELWVILSLGAALGGIVKTEAENARKNISV